MSGFRGLRFFICGPVRCICASVAIARDSKPWGSGAGCSRLGRAAGGAGIMAENMEFWLSSI